jgi:hypothetical protein
MVTYGYTQEEIKTGSVSMKVVKTCWSDLIKKMSVKKVRESREITRQQWEKAIDEYFVSEFPKWTKPEKEKPIKPIAKYEPEEEPALPATEEEMAKLADLPNQLRGGISTSDDEIIDFDFLKLMELPVPGSESPE